MLYRRFQRDGKFWFRFTRFWVSVKVRDVLLKHDPFLDVGSHKEIRDTIAHVLKFVERRGGL